MKSCAAFLVILASAAEATEQTGLLQFQRRGKFADANSNQEDPSSLATSGALGKRAMCPKKSGGLPTGECCRAIADPKAGASFPYSAEKPNECWEAGCLWRPVWASINDYDKGHTPCTPDGNIYYSGDGGLMVNKHGYSRPEYIKATVDKIGVGPVECSVDKDDPTPCLKAGGSSLELGNVTAGVYQAEMLIDCDGLSSFTLNNHHVGDRATLTVFVNSQEVSTNSGRNVLWTKARSADSYVLVDIKLSVEQGAADASAVLSVYSNGNIHEFDKCQQTKECMKKLRSKQGFEIRSNNALQMQCLSGELPSTHADFHACQTWKACTDSHQTTTQLRSLLKAVTSKLQVPPPAPTPTQAYKSGARGKEACRDGYVPIETQIECEAASQSLGRLFKGIRQTQAGRLPYCWLGSKGAAFNPKGDSGGRKRGRKRSRMICKQGLAAVSSFLLKETQGKSASCIEPRVSDPESWNCECHSAMIKACGNKCDDEMSDVCVWCKQELMCCYDGENRICQTWKDEYCSDYSCPPSAEDGASRLLERSSRSSGMKQDHVETVVDDKSCR